MSAAAWMILGSFPCILTSIKEMFPKEIKCQAYRPNHIELVETQFIKWTPDQSRIIFDFDSNQQLDHSTWSINYDGTNLTKIADAKPYDWITDEEKGTGLGPFHGTHADLSPDGVTLAYSVCDSNRKDLQFPDDHQQGSFDIAITTMSGEKPIVMAPDENEGINTPWLSVLYQGYPSWSPDGKQIAFIQGEVSSNRNKYPPTLFVANIDKNALLTNIRHIGFEKLQSAQPLWAPDGSHIALTTWGPGSDTWHVRVLRTNDMTTLPEPIGTSTTTAAWSPDSSKLAFAHYSTEERNHYPFLEIANGDGSGNIRIQLGEIPPVAAIDWHPDGSEILVGAQGLYTVNVQTHSIRELIPGPEEPRYRHIEPWKTTVTDLAWSPDGEQMAIRMGTSASRNTYKAYSCNISILTADRDGSNLTLIVSNEGELPHPFTATNRPTTLEETINDRHQQQDCPNPRRRP